MAGSLEARTSSVTNRSERASHRRSIPATDFRKQMFVDFAIDDMSEDEQIEALAAYTDHAEQILNSVKAAEYGPGGFEFKFRPQAGMYATKYTAWVIAVPLMRVEEMKLIEAEAAGMQDEARGIQLLTAFAQTRDASYTYGTHNEAYYNTANSLFQNEIWWQRRVELWGEGFGIHDTKRLNKPLVRFLGTAESTNVSPAFRFNMAATRPLGSCR